MQPIITESAQFFTATILEWEKLLKPEKYKDITISSLQSLIENKRLKVNAFVILDNHVHLNSAVAEAIASERALNSNCSEPRNGTRLMAKILKPQYETSSLLKFYN